VTFQTNRKGITTSDMVTPNNPKRGKASASDIASDEQDSVNAAADARAEASAALTDAVPKPDTDSLSNDKDDARETPLDDSSQLPNIKKNSEQVAPYVGGLTADGESEAVAEGKQMSPIGGPGQLDGRHDPIQADYEPAPTAMSDEEAKAAKKDAKEAAKRKDAAEALGHAEDNDPGICSNCGLDLQSAIDAKAKCAANQPS
jgi:hypothetical protein